MESYFDLRDRLYKSYYIGQKINPVVAEKIAEEQEQKETAFVVAPPGSDKLYFTGRVKAEHWETPVNRAFSYVTGRYVQAETANQNGAFWAAEDLQFGAPSVAFGPVNMLHEEKAIVGTISEAHLHEQDDRFGTHITTCNVLWKYIFPGAVQAIEQAGAKGELWQSMECVADKIKCMGCEEEFEYAGWMRDKSSGCDHLTKGGTRRLVNPTFLATGIILGSARPAWGDADVEVRKVTANLVDESEMTAGNMERDFAMNLVDQILHWANRE